VLGIEFSFPGGRYHATPWDAHVNEGIVEWPPSPWRILRSLIATRHLKAVDEVPEQALYALVESLSAELPSYALPLGAVGFHTRHYMPLFAEKTTKVFDTFLHLPPGERIVVAWPTTTLDPGLSSALACLVERLGYLGRAEAWVEGRLCDASSMDLDCRPFADRTLDDDEIDLVRALAPMPPRELARWRAAAVNERVTRALDEKRRKARNRGKAADKLKLSPKEVAALESALPRSIYEALNAETDVMRERGWNRPPGSRWVEYARPRPERRPVARSARVTRQLPTVARYALAGKVLPRLTEGVFEAERVRVALLSHSDGAPVFTGRDPTSGDLLAGHRHAFILPEANGHHGNITHITLYARMGFDDCARAALERLRSVWQRSGHDLQLVLLGLGECEDFGGTRTEAGQCAVLATADSWVSRTPFVPTRHPKQRRTGEPKIDEHGLVIGSPEHDLIRLLLEQGFPRPLRVERIPDTDLGGKPTRWLAFRTRRKKGHGRRATVHGVGFRLVFPSPVRGPIAVGYGAHFGLGYFVPAPSES
jgi:CRISPR-associated protein Csb2